MKYTHDMLQNSIKELANDIENGMSQNEEEYDFVVGLTRGGLVPAVCLSHTLNVPMISINWSTRDSCISYLDQQTLQRIKGKKILIVEDIVDSGETLKSLCEALKDVCVFDIAALVYNTSQSIKPRYYDVTIDRKVYADWIDFFWEM